MAAPTWPTDADGGERASSQTNEEAHRALLRAFLFGNPPQQLGEEEAGTALSTLNRRLETWLRMVSPVDFVLAEGAPAGTDGNHIFLPPALPLPFNAFGDPALYRVMAFFQLGLLEGGFLQDRAFLGEIYRDWTLRSCYHLLVAQWILEDGAKRYPGFRRDLQTVSAMDSAGRLRVNLTEVPREGIPRQFIPLYDALTLCLNWPQPGRIGKEAASAVQAVRKAENAVSARLVATGQAHLLCRVFQEARLGPPPIPDFLGLIRPEWILGVEAREQEGNKDWMKGQVPLRRLRQAVKEGRTRSVSRRFRDKIKAKMALPPSESISSMPAYGPARDEARKKATQQKDPSWKVGQSASDLLLKPAANAPEGDGQPHKEWDHKRGAYRLSGTRVFSPNAHTGPLENYRSIVENHKREINQIRSRFEALRVEERWVGRQLEGPEIDLSAAIRAQCDLAAGHQPQQNIYRRFIRRQRDLCVMTLVDLSGSTKGAVLYEQQRAIVLFSAALQALDLPHAFYGFNGSAPHQCMLSRIKAFDARYDESVQQRLGNLRAEGGTRLGAHIREATRLLDQQPQSRRLLLLLSDGKPEARGEYRGQYGEADSEMAVKEARRLGVVVHCISMDASDEAPVYLKRIFSPGHFHLVEQADQLPARLPEVFRSLVR
jgi:Mg-chelatase subunit ChlD